MITVMLCYEWLHAGREKRSSLHRQPERASEKQGDLKYALRILRIGRHDLWEQGMRRKENQGRRKNEGMNVRKGIT